MEGQDPTVLLQNLALSWGVDLYSPAFAAKLDATDPLAHTRQLFHVPKKQSVRPDGAKGHVEGKALD